MINLRGHTPQHLITADGKPFNMDRILKIEITDAAGFESDELVITLDDSFPQIARPREGAKLAVSLGFKETGLIAMGTFVFEEFGREGLERTATLIAKAADHAASLKEPKTRSWDTQTLGAVVRKVAGEHGLAAAISDKLASQAIKFIAQTEESDQHFLTRLGKRVGAIIAPKDGRLLVTERRSGKTASGQSMPKIEVTLGRLVNAGAYSVQLKPRSRYSKVIANWQDRASGTVKRFTFQAAEKGPSITLREVFQDEADASRAAKAKATDLRSGEGELALELIGDPLARAEAPLSVSGVSLDVDGEWIASTVTHVWDYGEGGGATTTVEAEFGKEKEEAKKGTKAAPKSRKPAGEYVSVLDRN